MAATYAPAERQYYDQLFDSVDKDQTGMLAGQDALPLMTKSNLPQQTLGEIWALSDPDNNGFLTKESWYRAARIIGWLQKGGKSVVEESLLSQAGPYPTFNGLPGPPSQAPLSAQTTGQRPLAANTTGSSLPPLTAADRTKFTRIFVGCGPHNGLVAGDKARDVFVKSQLSYDKLGLIWSLADTQQRGSLDLPDFIIGMFLIQTCMANPNAQLPATLPPGMYEQASGGRAPPNAPSSPLARQNTGPQSPIRPQYTEGTIQPQRTGQGSQIQAQSSPSRQGTMTSLPSGQAGSGFSSGTMGSAFSQNRGNQQQWDITSEAKATSDRFFAQLDQQNRGTIDGDVAVPFMLQSQLDEGTLATIWDLSDIRHEGKLDRDLFAVAMHLINNKLAGKDLPPSLPNSLVPPSLRQEFGGGQQEVLDNGPSNATKDLFDLFADDPPPPAVQQATPSAFGQNQNQSQPFSAGGFSAQPLQAQGTGQGVPSRQLSPAPTGNRFVPQSSFGLAATNTAPTARSPPPPSDLLGEDAADAPPDVPDNSAEIGNKKNQLENTQRGLSSLESTRATLEKSDKSNTSQLQELEASLATARSRHEEESKIVTDLRSRVSDQQEKMKNLNMDTIAAESDLSAMRSERDELEQALLRDKEEIRGLQKKMKEADEEKTTLKNLLEKLKKETRQQKGMVTIAKKQLSTSEGNRDNAQKDLDDFHKNAQDEDEEDETRGRGLGAGATAGLGALGGAALAGGAATAFGHNQDARSASPFGQSQSPISPETAAGIALPATPQALSPVATGASNRSNNPFDRLRTQSRGPAPPVPQAQSPPTATTPTFERSASPALQEEEASQEEPRSPAAIATSALSGAGTVVGLAAGVAVAGAAAVFGVAKDAITGEDHSDEKETHEDSEKALNVKDEDKTPTAEDADPFGAPTSQGPVAEDQETDVFGAVTGPSQSGFSESLPADTDPFGAPTSVKPVSKGIETDAFGAQPDFAAPPPAEADPFGASSQNSFDNFDNGFGDSFGASSGGAAVPKAPSGNADFDSAFDDFDEAPATSADASIPEATSQMTASPERDAMSPGIPVGIPKSALPNLRNDLERTDSTQAVAPASPVLTSRTETPVPAEPASSRSIADEPTEELLSSDEEDAGPEDLEAPKRGYTSTSQQQDDDDDVPLASLKPAAVAAPVLASPVDAPKGRRSAPPPPASKSSTGMAPIPIDDFDPFGAPSSTAAVAAPPTTAPFDNDFGSLPPGAAPAQAQTTGPQTSKFDDDDFDFSDMPPAQVDNSEPPVTSTKNTSAFDDEFAGFDDEFESVPTNPNSGSDRSNMSKSYEMVSPTQGQSQQAQQSTGNTDEWGQPAGQQLQRPAPPASGFSFDDAFGGDFEPTHASQPASQETSYAPPAGPPPSSGIQSLAKPALPERKPSAVGTGPQPDDLDDVKRLCSMGFPRELAVGALESNAYDFQKALNVLLAN